MYIYAYILCIFPDAGELDQQFLPQEIVSIVNLIAIFYHCPRYTTGGGYPLHLFCGKGCLTGILLWAA